MFLINNNYIRGAGLCKTQTTGETSRCLLSLLETVFTYSLALGYVLTIESGETARKRDRTQITNTRNERGDTICTDLIKKIKKKNSINNFMPINVITYTKWTNSLKDTICQNSHKKKQSK